MARTRLAREWEKLLSRWRSLQPTPSFDSRNFARGSCTMPTITYAPSSLPHPPPSDHPFPTSVPSSVKSSGCITFSFVSTLPRFTFAYTLACLRCKRRRAAPCHVYSFPLRAEYQLFQWHHFLSCFNWDASWKSVSSVGGNGR